MINLLVKEIDDEKLRENFKRLQKELTAIQVILQFEWKFIELTFSAAVTNFKYPHNLSYIPRDVLPLYSTSGVTVTWNQDSFDRTNLDITTNGACTVRALIGRYVESAGQQ